MLNIPEDTSSVLNLFLTQAIQYKNDQPKFPINEIKQMSRESPEIANQLFQQQIAKQEFKEEMKITR